MLAKEDVKDSMKQLQLTNKHHNQSVKEGTVNEENGYNQNNNRQQPPRHSFANDFDFSNVVLAKLKDLRTRYRRPVSLNSLTGEFGQKISRAELIEILRGLQEAGEIRNVPGQELSYDVY